MLKSQGGKTLLPVIKQKILTQTRNAGQPVAYEKLII